MDADCDAITDYKSSLNELSFNSKPLINMLTMLAEDYKDSKAPEIVRSIEQRLHHVSADHKLPLLYLLDSICKNVGIVYVKLFTQNIVSTFCEVFEKVDEKTRLSLYKLRQTWNPIFPVRKLYAIDVRIHQQLDPAWPITAPKPEQMKAIAKSAMQSSVSVVKAVQCKPQQQVHINPKFFSDAKQAQLGLTPSLSPSLNPTVKPSLNPTLNQSANQSLNPSRNPSRNASLAPSLAPSLSPSTAGPEAELAKQLFQKQSELLTLQKQKLELEVLNERRRLEEQARALQEKEHKLKQKEHQLQRSNSPNGKKIKKRKRSRSRRSRSPSPVNQKSRSPTHRWSRSPTERLRESPSRMNRQHSPSFSMRQTNYSPHRPRSRSPNMLKNQFMPQQSVSMTQSQASVALPSALLPTPGSVGQPPVPTTIPAPTILAQPEMLSITSIAGSHVEPNVSTINTMRPITSGMPVMGHSVHSKLHPNVNSNTIDRPINPILWAQDRDYRKEFDNMLTEAQEKLRSGAISSADHDVIVRAINESHYTRSLILNPPDTVSMLVDGKLRQLFYLDDRIAVVLLGAPETATFEQLIQIDPKMLDPRQISFEGKPTKVFIDSDRGGNEYIILEFNGMPKTFIRYDHEQRIKFGGPAKEIILNGQSHPAKFGGPPIEVWFNGCTTCSHSLKLDGPTPRVNLSEERCYDLWANVVKKATTELKNTVNATRISHTNQKTSDINNLITKLIAAGIITSNGSNSNSQQKSKEEQKDKREDDKNIIVEPPLKLASDSLKLSRATVIAALYNGIQCTNCSLRFEDKDQPFLGDKTRYSKHLDWHFRQNRRDKAKPNSTMNSSMKRNWFYSLSLWCQFKEVTYEEDSTSLFVNEDNDSDEEQEIPLSTVVAETDEMLNHCAVCAEKFDQQWHEEEEEWRLKNAVRHNGKIYHPFCLTDFITQNEMTDNDNEIMNEQTESMPVLDDKTVSTKHELSDSSTEENNLTIDLPVIDNFDNYNNKEEEKSFQNEETTELSDEQQKLSEDSTLQVQQNEVISDVTSALIPSEQQDVEETNIEVIEFEIPLNFNDEMNKDLHNILNCDKVFSSEGVTNSRDETQNEKVVLQQGGIVIKMKASNLQQQTATQVMKDQEVSDNEENAVKVKGHELSSLCSIM